MLLRPRTGLQDMTLELDPGRRARRSRRARTVPLAQTEPNVNPDEILASLDGDTQAYLRLLLAGGAEGLGPQRRGVLGGLPAVRADRARPRARSTGALAERRAQHRPLDHNFKLVSEELGARDTRLADFVDSSNAVLGSFANQEAAIRSLAPGAARGAGGDAGRSRPATSSPWSSARASEKLIPGAQALGPALQATRPFFRETVAPIRDQIRPFTKQVRPPIRQLADIAAAPFARDDRRAEDRLRRAQRLFNALAYNPAPASERGATCSGCPGSTTTTNDASRSRTRTGPLRRGLVLQSCQTASLAEGSPAAADSRSCSTLLQLSRHPDPPTQICPLDP